MNSAQFFSGTAGIATGYLFRAACAGPAVAGYTRQEAQFHSRSYMFRAKALALARLLCSHRLSPNTRRNSISQDQAPWSSLERLCLGPRPIDSPAHKKLQRLIMSKLRAFGCRGRARYVHRPNADRPEKDEQSHCEGSRQGGDQSVVLTGHYDTKIMDDRNFVGANDGGSSTGFLLEMARCSLGNLEKMTFIWFGWMGKRPSGLDRETIVCTAAGIWPSVGERTERWRG